MGLFTKKAELKARIENEKERQKREKERRKKALIKERQIRSEAFSNEDPKEFLARHKAEIERERQKKEAERLEREKQKELEIQEKKRRKEEFRKQMKESIKSLNIIEYGAVSIIIGLSITAYSLTQQTRKYLNQVPDLKIDKNIYGYQFNPKEDLFIYAKPTQDNKYTSYLSIRNRHGKILEYALKKDASGRLSLELILNEQNQREENEPQTPNHTNPSRPSVPWYLAPIEPRSDKYAREKQQNNSQDNHNYSSQ